MAKPQARGEDGALDFRFGGFEQRRDTVRRIAFDITEQENEAFPCGQLPKSLFQVCTADIATAEFSGAGFEQFQRRDGRERKPTVQLIHENAIQIADGRPGLMPECAYKCRFQNRFGFLFVAGHVVGDGKNVVTMAFKYVAPFFDRTIGMRIADDNRWNNTCRNHRGETGRWV